DIPPAFSFLARVCQNLLKHDHQLSSPLTSYLCSISDAVGAWALLRIWRARQALSSQNGTRLSVENFIISVSSALLATVFAVHLTPPLSFYFF
ncbi:hypothetical protein EV424DRAFT_1418141, partial [Suillus variegatus]